MANSVVLVLSALPIPLRSGAGGDLSKRDYSHWGIGLRGF